MDTSEIAPIYVSADEREIPLQAELLGYDNRHEDLKKPVYLRWKHTGGGSYDESHSKLQDNGVAFNTFTVSKNAGDKKKAGGQVSTNTILI